jgi:hypothetical protein
MSQTPKFSPEKVEQIISVIEKSTYELEDLLTTEMNYEEKINKVIELLDKRDKFFKEFEQIPNDDNLEIYFRNNHNKWLNRIKKITEIEKINLEILEKNMKLQSEKVKDINKQKKLLLYKKREI